jgi:hypothetical protein
MYDGPSDRMTIDGCLNSAAVEPCLSIGGTSPFQVADPEPDKQIT